MRIITDSSKQEIKLYGIIWDGDGPYIASELSKLQWNGLIKIRLHTHGGSVFDGNLIKNAVDELDNEVHWMVDGIAASMGSILLTSGDKVFIAKNAFIMTHAPTGAVVGNAGDMRSAAKLLESLEKQFISVYSERTGKSKKDVAKWLVNDNWFDAEQALSEGLVHGIIDPALKDKNISAIKEMPIKAILGGPTSKLSDFDCGESVAGDKKTDTTDTNDKNKYRNMKKELIEALGLENVTAESSDTAIIKAVEEKVNGLKNQVTAKTNELTTLLDKDKEVKEKAVKLAVSAAITAGKLKEEQRETYETIGFTNGIESLNAVLEPLQVNQTITSKINPDTQKVNAGTVEGREDWNWDKWQREDPRGLEKLNQGSEEDKKVYQALFDGKFK